jgi:16S rRNA (guanine527-N7)-methyltransferase
LLDLALTDAQLAAFETYYHELVDWNTRVNLTAITGYSEVQVRHFLDSLTCLLAVRGVAVNAPPRVIDVSSGGGFPGLPLKIVCPNWQLTLLEAVRKKVLFLEHVVGRLQLTEVQIIHGRAEDLGRDLAHREQYDLVLARAVADLPVLVEYALPLIRGGGALVAQKGRQVEDEVERARPAMNWLGGRLDAVIPVLLPDLDEPRHLLRIVKIASTPGKYPRRAGVPEKRPLG